jgi:hypothetical protein
MGHVQSLAIPGKTLAIQSKLRQNIPFQCSTAHGLEQWSHFL